LPEERAYLAGLTDNKPDLNRLANQIERLEHRGLMQHQIASQMGFSELEIAAIKSLAGRKEASSNKERYSSTDSSSSSPSVR